MEGVDNPGEQAVGGFILGGNDFVKWVQETFVVAQKDEKEIPQLKALRPRITVETIVEAICREFGCGEERILKKGHKRNYARDFAIFIARNHSGISCKDLGRFFGKISGAAITRRCNVLNEKLARDKALRKKMNSIEERIVNS